MHSILFVIYKYFFVFLLADSIVFYLCEFNNKKKTDRNNAFDLIFKKKFVFYVIHIKYMMSCELVDVSLVFSYIRLVKFYYVYAGDGTVST